MAASPNSGRCRGFGVGDQDEIEEHVLGIAGAVACVVVFCMLLRAADLLSGH